MDALVELLNRTLENSAFFAIPLAFIGGLLTSFTPCVYPMFPIVIGVIGAREVTSKKQAFLLSFSYVFGLSIVYATLGMLSAITGSFFGEASTKPLVNLAIGAFFVFFSLAMFGFYQLPVPAFLQGNNQGQKGKGVIGSFLIGLGSGFVAAPCTGPVIGALLVYIGTTKDIVFGALLMLSFSFGMGFLLMIAGTFSGLIQRLPKSGSWMNLVKKGMAFLILVMGTYFLYKAYEFAGF